MPDRAPAGRSNRREDAMKRRCKGFLTFAFCAPLRLCPAHVDEIVLLCRRQPEASVDSVGWQPALQASALPSVAALAVIPPNGSFRPL